MADIAFYEAFEEEEAALREIIPRDLKAFITPLTIQESGHRHPPAAFISIRTQSSFPAGWLSSVDAILTRSTGYDHILDLRNRHGFGGHCGYLPEYCSRAVAEQAALLWLALLRRLPDQLEKMSTFSRDGLSGSECLGRTLSVFGVGNIGSEVVNIGKGLDMRVFGVDIVERHPGRVKYVDPETALKAADVIACCMNLTTDNYGYFGTDVWRTARPGTIFVNIARGELSPAATLLEALQSGRLAGVGLDVYPEEKALAEYLRGGRDTVSPEVKAVLQMRTMRNVIFTPHNAFNTTESVGRKARQSLQQIEAYMANKSFKWPIPMQ